MKRYDCLRSLFSKMPDDVIVVGNLGDTTSHILMLRRSEANVFPINLGSCAAVGLGLALGLPHRRVVVLDGDGNLLLNLAVLADVANQGPRNLSLVVLDNQCYQSGGGLPSATAGLADLAGIAREAGIRNSRTIKDMKEFEAAVDDILQAPGPLVVVAKIEKDEEMVQPPVTYNAMENKFKFIRYIERTEGIGIIAKSRGARVIV